MMGAGVERGCAGGHSEQMRTTSRSTFSPRSLQKELVIANILLSGHRDPRQRPDL